MTAEIIGLWLTAVCLIGIVVLATAWVREKRAERDAEERRLDEGIKEIRAQELAERTVHIAPSPTLARRPMPRPTVQQRNAARLDQQARHAAVITATGPLTREFNAIVARNTGRAPAGRGPREADLRLRRTEQPAPAWAQDMLPLEIGA